MQRIVDWGIQAIVAQRAYTFDLTAWSKTGLVLSSATILSVEPTGLTVAPPNYFKYPFVTVRVSGGVHATRYSVALLLNFQGGVQDEVVGLIGVVDPVVDISDRVGPNMVGLCQFLGEIPDETLGIPSIPPPPVVIPSQGFSVAGNSSAWYFMGVLSGQPVAIPAGPRVPSENFTVGKNASIWYFNGQLSGASVAIPVPPGAPSSLVPSLDFRDKRNTGLRMFRGQPAGAFYAPRSNGAVAATQNFTFPRNSSVAYFDGRLSG